MLLRQFVFCVIALTSIAVGAAPLTKPNVMIILDDLGYKQSDLSAFTLPNEVTFSILPQTPLAKIIAEKAKQQGRAVMLHMPMQAAGGQLMGPLGLTTDMYPATITQTLREALASVPNAVGVNNHMGSAFTAKEQAMLTIMQEIKRQGLFYVDSRTSIDTTAQEAANKLGVPNTSRQIFLDHEPSPDFIAKQFERTKKLAKRYGSVVVIAHPHPETLAFLSQFLPTLAGEGIQLTSVADHLLPSKNTVANLSNIPVSDVQLVSSKE